MSGKEKQGPKVVQYGQLLLVRCALWLLLPVCFPVVNNTDGGRWIH